MDEPEVDRGENVEESASRKAVLDFPVVGVGASAGGVEAMRKFFGAVPAKPGVAFIAVLHLSPDHQSNLADVLGKASKLRVEAVHGDTAIKRDRIYVIVPDTALRMEGGTLRVGPAGERPRHPIDMLFSSLADEQREKSVGVILSGTGTNGASGVLSIKDKGGLVIVQDPETAEYSGMPSATLGTGVADLVLTPEQMPGELIAYISHPYVRSPSDAATLHEGEQPSLNTLLALLRARAGFDFRGYKRPTLLRRIRRRMGLGKVDGIPAYVEALRDDPDELEALARDLLINVTSFFRDRDAWDALRSAAIEPLVRGRDPEQTIRVWVPACSTGEEAYSIAMLLIEAVDSLNKGVSVKVFSTDAAQHVLARARMGVFPSSIAEEMPADRLDRFFEKHGDYYRAGKRLRETIVFAPHNMLADPPFSRMDLVSCRNLLIYLNPQVQKRLIALLHFSLREGGYLFLGTAETVGEQENMFHTLSKKWRIYRRLGPTRHDIVHFPLAELGERRLPAHSGGSMQGSAESARMALLGQFAPPSVLIDERMRILYFHGDTDAYLRQPRGEPTQELLLLARDDLAPRLRAAVHRALRGGEPMTIETRRAVDGPGLLRIVATPLANAEGEQRRVLVSFVDVPQASPASLAALAPQPMRGTESELEEALRASQVELRDAVEQLESSNEELKASNEEMISMNEELQATNEELETSKEELQSLNEEMNTVNVQLQGKLEELEARTNDLNNLLNSSAIATLFLSEDLRIRWFTPPLGALLDVIPSDIGRPLLHLAQKFEDPNFVEDTREVMRNLQPREREVTSNDGGWYVRRILPYRTEDNRIEGVVATFIDITERKRGEQEVALAREFAERIVETVRQPLLVLDGDLRVVSANRNFLETYGLAHERVIGRDLLALGDGQWNLPGLTRLLKEILPQQETMTDYALDGDFRGIGQRSMLLNARRLDGSQLMLLAIEDVTDRRRGERRQQALLDELQHRVKNLFANIFSLIRLSSKNAADVPAFVDRLSGRLAALERTQQVLMRREGSTVRLRSLVDAELHAHGTDEGGAVTVDGPDLGIGSRTAQALGMVVHELATNAVKHGALAHSGRIHIAWTRLEDGPRLLFRWRETGVPNEGTKIDGGFGSHLIRQVVPFMLAGSAQLEHMPDGVRCVLELPIEDGETEDGETEQFDDGETEQ